jgi:hypothetical protein
MRNAVIATDEPLTAQDNGDVSQLGNVRVTQDESDSIPPHPLGIKPAGNAYTASSNARDCMGSFQILPDELLAIALEYLEATSLLKLGAICKQLYAFCRSEDLWKAMFIEYVKTTHAFRPFLCSDIVSSETACKSRVWTLTCISRVACQIGL